MNEILDKLIIRILFTFFICSALFVYKYAHAIFYPSRKKQILKKIYPSENYVDTLHIFARIIGIAIIFSTLEFNEYQGLFKSTLDFFILGTMGMGLYLGSLYITESIILYNFDYVDECLKKKNAAYGIVSFANAIALSLIIQTLFDESEHSLVILFILWLFALVLYGFSTKLYKYVSSLPFNSLMIQKNLGMSISYAGFLLGTSIVLISAFNHEHHEITSYCLQVVLKAILAALVFPIFRMGLITIFRIQELKSDTEEPAHLGLGVYEGAIFVTCGLLTSIIIGQIHFGTIYPFF